MAWELRRLVNHGTHGRGRGKTGGSFSPQRREDREDRDRIFEELFWFELFKKVEEVFFLVWVVFWTLVVLNLFSDELERLRAFS